MKGLASMPALRRTVMAGVLALAGMAAGGAPARAASDHQVTMASMSYGQIPTGLQVGDTITWTNRDTVPHTVTARDRSFDLRVNPGRSARMTLQKAGSFPFYCIYHTTMRGTLNVAGK